MLPVFFAVAATSSSAPLPVLQLRASAAGTSVLLSLVKKYLFDWLSA